MQRTWSERVTCLTSSRARSALKRWANAANPVRSDSTSREISFNIAVMWLTLEHSACQGPGARITAFTRVFSSYLVGDGGTCNRGATLHPLLRYRGLLDLQRPDARIPVCRVHDAVGRIERHTVGAIRELLRIVGGPGDAVRFQRREVRLITDGVASGVGELRVHVRAVANDRVVAVLRFGSHRA